MMELVYRTEKWINDYAVYLKSLKEGKNLMNRFIIVLLMLITTLLSACSHETSNESKFNNEDYYETMTPNDVLIRDICVLEYNISKTSKSKYSGYSINDNYDLTILHTGFKRSEIKKYKEIVDSRKISFKKIKYSLETLEAVRNDVSREIPSIANRGVKISSLCIDTLNNRIRIGLYGELNQEKSKFLDVLDKSYHKYIMFTYEEPAVPL